MGIFRKTDPLLQTNTTTMSFKRPDGRGNNEAREIKLSNDGLGRVDGSARFSFGEDGKTLPGLAAISIYIMIKVGQVHWHPFLALSKSD